MGNRYTINIINIRIMKYYRLRCADVKKNTVGVLTQIDKAIGSHDRWGIDSFNKIGGITGGWNDNIIPKKQLFNIHTKARLTNILSSAFFGDFHQSFVLNDELYEFLLNYKLAKHKSFRMSLVQVKNKVTERINNYRILAICDDSLNEIDFKSSKIYKHYHFKGEEDSEILFNSPDEIRSFYSKYVMKARPYFTLEGEQLVLKKSFDFDLFRIEYISRGYFVSEKLKSAIEEIGFTGMKFEHTKQLKVKK